MFTKENLRTMAMGPRAEDLILEARCILACSHFRPDGDAIGSLLAIGWALERLGKIYTLVCPHATPLKYRFLSGWERITQGLAPSLDYDLVIALDTASLDRFGDLAPGIGDLDVPMLVVDHHATNTRFGTFNRVEPGASATTEVVFSLLRELDLQLDATVATHLLTGIVTDTLGFRTSSTSLRTMETVLELVRVGAPLSTVSEWALNRRPLSALRLWASVLPDVQRQDHVVWGEIPLDVRRASGYGEGDDADLVEFLATVEEAHVAAIFYEREDGTVKLSLRSRPGTDVAAVAKQLGGGGHEQAAGATLEGPLELARLRVLSLLEQRLGAPAGPANGDQESRI